MIQFNCLHKGMQEFWGMQCISIDVSSSGGEDYED